MKILMNMIKSKFPGSLVRFNVNAVTNIECAEGDN